METGKLENNVDFELEQIAMEIQSFGEMLKALNSSPYQFKGGSLYGLGLVLVSTSERIQRIHMNSEKE